MNKTLFSFMEEGEDAPDVPVLRPAQTMTPMMAQYMEIRAVNPGYLLFYRMGDFYELFFEDAEVASRALGITLTKRGKHLDEDIPMCGVPVHAAEDYLHRLIALGHKVAICEQLEDPAEAKKRGSKAVVKRDVVRLVTPGTLTEDALLEPWRENYLASLAPGLEDGETRSFGLAWVDISTGAFGVVEVDRGSLGGEIARIAPAELILPQSLHDDGGLKAELKGAKTLSPMVDETFHPKKGEARITSFYEVATSDSFGGFSMAEKAACGALISYVERTQLGAKPALSFPKRHLKRATMRIDAATRANLELTETLKGKRDGALLALIDETRTALGSRLLAGWLSAPLTDVDAILERQAVVSFLHNRREDRARLREALKGTPDMMRSLSRLSLGRGGPRDLGAMRDGLQAVSAVIEALAKGVSQPPRLEALMAVLQNRPHELFETLSAALKDDLPLLARDGGFVARGFSPALDEAVEMRDGARAVIARLQADYIALTGLKALKIKHNNVLGYFVEVPASHHERMITGDMVGVFYHRQTLANAVRFSSEKLAELEGQIASSAERVRAQEEEVFEKLVAAVLSQSDKIKELANGLAELDVYAGLAELAFAKRWVAPHLTKDLSFEIKGGRHPVVEAALQKQSQQFAANDCDLSGFDKGGLYIVTGPNMAGKSTYLRQNALIAILAQIGSFVPANSAKLGVVDQVFSRVGAADDLASGRSTFMVEMVETAAILNQATAQSLVILDEIGRGTSTYDGLSIAQATLEHLYEMNGCRGLFATHYHELTKAVSHFDRVKNVSVSVREWGGEIVFLHKVIEGAADRSYGIQVARLAGLPRAVIKRAQSLLKTYEAGDAALSSLPLSQELPVEAGAEYEALREALESLDPDQLSPREALEALYALKKTYKETIL